MEEEFKSEAADFGEVIVKDTDEDCICSLLHHIKLWLYPNFCANAVHLICKNSPAMYTS